MIKRITILGLLIGLLLLPMATVYAADSAQISVTVTITQTISVSLSPGSWPIGAASEGGTVNTLGIGPDYFTATNNGNGPEDLQVTVSDSDDWGAGTTAGAETFVMSLSTGGGTPSWTPINPSGGATLASDLAKGASQSFDLQLALPTSTAYGGVEQTINITVSASAS